MVKAVRPSSFLLRIGQSILLQPNWLEGRARLLGDTISLMLANLLSLAERENRR